MARMVFVFLTIAVLNSLKAVSQVHLERTIDSSGRKISLRPLPQNFYKQNLGYICKKEIQLQKATTLPLFIRLGSKEYVDWLEQKPNAVKRN